MKEFELKEEHIKLLRETNVRWEDCEFGAPAIDCKRPYGNSDVIRDIAEIIGIKPTITSDCEEVFTESEGEYMRKLHEETEIALQIILKTGQFKPGKYILEDDFSNDWKLA